MSLLPIALALLLPTLPAQETAKEWVERGMDHFVAGEIPKSIEAFDKAVKLDPNVEPHLWQRGISYYYTGQFEEGRKQFEIHRKVNPNDVENSVWWYLCMARLNRRAEAQEKLLPVGPDERIPMTEVYSLYSGKGSEKEVLAAMEQGKPSDRELRMRRFYGYLYLGLFAEAAGNAAKARAQILKAVQQNVGGYMWEVARTHLESKPKRR
ncbi:MAG: tetratricopeptide repeat protein [Bryobacterales bacterium]|nr:tetratricopeptide repeat protein [Bryobacterales bacterium]